ncbi:MAG: AMP-binding protein, partial [Tannerella sp.]|nr:AMP-binding protein [Tannerella sp.]
MSIVEKNMLPRYHFAELIYRQAEKYGDRTAIRWHDEAAGRWRPVSWIDFAARVRLVSQALIARGVNVGENIGIYSQNMPHCFYVDYGAYGVRAV